MWYYISERIILIKSGFPWNFLTLHVCSRNSKGQILRILIHLYGSSWICKLLAGSSLGGEVIVSGNKHNLQSKTPINVKLETNAYLKWLILDRIVNVLYKTVKILHFFSFNIFTYILSKSASLDNSSTFTVRFLVG